MEKSFATINASLKDLNSDRKRVVITVVDTNTGEELKSYGSVSGYVCSGDRSTWRVNLCFKTTDNDSHIKAIAVKHDGSYQIISMIRNKPIPSSYVLVSVDAVNRYTEEEEKRVDLMNEIHGILNRRCSEYIHFTKPILLVLPSINDAIFVEYFTKDWFGIDDIINYRTDHIQMSRLSFDDLVKVKNMLSEN